jgi:hypothetical protein
MGLEYKSGVLLFVWEGVLRIASMWENQNTEKIDYLLPASIQREPLLLSIPSAYTDAISTLIFLKLKEGQRAGWVLPSLEVRFNFSDISGIQYNRSFELSISMMTLTSNQFRASLECRTTM